MRQITLRGIPEDIEAVAQEEARTKGISLNKAFLALLRRGAERQLLPLGKPAVQKADFSRFKGVWSKEEADAFDAALVEQRKVDPELW